MTVLLRDLQVALRNFETWPHCEPSSDPDPTPNPGQIAQRDLQIAQLHNTRATTANVWGKVN